MTRYFYDNAWVAGVMMTVHGIPLMWQGDPWLEPVTKEMLLDDIEAGTERRYYVRPGYLDSITVELVLSSSREGKIFYWPQAEEEA